MTILSCFPLTGVSLAKLPLLHRPKDSTAVTGNVAGRGHYFDVAMIPGQSTPQRAPFERCS
jgi:hypothetical protein